VASQPTGSQLERVLACPASFHLPQVNDYTSSDAAVRGNCIHRYLQLLIDGQDREQAEQVLITEKYDMELVEECAELEIDFDRREFSEMSYAEVTFYYNVSTGDVRHGGQNLNRDYKCGPFEIALTLDVICVPGPLQVRIVDWKSGHTDLGNPAKLAQLLMGALAAYKYYKVTFCEVAIGYVRNGRIWFEEATVDIFDLEDFAQRLVELQSRSAAASVQIAKGETPDVTTGTHCKYCPAFSACPATVALVRSLPDLEATSGNGTLTRSRMGDAWVQLKQYRKAIAAMEKAIRAEAEREPIELPNGKTLGLVNFDGNEQLDGRIAHDVVAAVTGDRAVADTAVSFAATKAGIKRALTAHCKSGTRAKVEREILDGIREAGGSKRPKKREVKEY
jgi:hypothetical protein